MIRFGLAMTIVAVAVLLYPSANLEAASPGEILERADRARGHVPGLVWTVKMTSVERGRERDQTLEVKARNEDVLVTFVQPPRVKGQKLLMVGRNMWFIKPGVSKPVPISPRQKLMGEAANGDIASTNYFGDYEAVIVREEEIQGEPCYVLDLTARNKRVTYDRIVYWVSKQRVVGVKAEFYTVSGKMFKSAEFEYDNVIDYWHEEIPFVSKMVIRDAIRKKDVTMLEYGNTVVQEFPDSTFNLNLLMK